MFDILLLLDAGEPGMHVPGHITEAASSRIVFNNVTALE
jgi:hypothetical protein